MAIDFTAICEAATGRWAEIYQQLCGLPADVLVKKSNDSPCPKCNSKSTIWPATDAASTGRICCRKCMDNKMPNDGISVVAHYAEVTQGEAASAIANLLGLRISQANNAPVLDLIDRICSEKRMPRNGFEAYEPAIAARGRERKPCVRVPVWDDQGQKTSYFDLVPDCKGFFQRGEGKAGLFLPGRLPKKGETWTLSEGCKDPSALTSLGYAAAGLPSCLMPTRFAELFRGVHCIIIPDLDRAGLEGAQRTGARLAGIAASIKVARLPGEVVEKGGEDVRDILHKPNGEQLVRLAIDSAEPWLPSDGDLYDQGGRPEVELTLNYGHAVDQVMRCVGNLGWQSPWIPEPKRERLKIYQRGGQLVHVVVESEVAALGGKVSTPAGFARIRPLPAQQLQIRISDACQLYAKKVTADGDEEKQACPPPKWLIDGLATRGEFDGVRKLVGIVTAPTLRHDGSILQKPGHDERSGLLYRPSDTFPPVPETPTQNDARKSAELLLSTVRDFPFASEADRSGWLAMLLSLVGRPAIHGGVPLMLLTATTRGSGKSLLADAAATIAYGRPAARKIFTPKDEETRKSITSIAIEALPAVLLDNLDVTLASASLDAALTGETWTDRVLGSSATTGELPMRTIWIATGNNVRLGSDIARRVLPIRLESTLERPELRNDFEHADLISWVKQNRPELAVAALVILRAYIAASCPEQPNSAWGNYEDWSRLVRGAIVWAGLADPLLTREEATAEDQSSAVVSGLIDGLLEIDERCQGITAREIIDELSRDSNSDKFPVLREVVSEVATYRGVVDAKRLQYALRKYKGRVAKGWRVASEDGRSRVKRWKAERINGDDGDDAKTDPHHHPHHKKTSNLPGETLFGDDGDDTSKVNAQGNELCVTCDTHTFVNIEGRKSSSSSSPSSPLSDPTDCFHEQVEERTSDGRIKTTCRLCGKFFGYRPVEVAR